MQHTRVHNAPRERQHEFSVRDAPKVIRQVRVNDIPAAKDQRLLDLLYSLLGITLVGANYLGRRVDSA